MGRNKRKNNWREKRQQAKKAPQPHEDYQTVRMVLENKSFEAYYRMQLKDEFPSDSDFNRFMVTLREKLPVTFRINENMPNYKNFLSKIKAPDFIRKMIALPEEKKQGETEKTDKSMQEEKPTDEESKENKGEKDGNDDFDSISEQIKLLNVPWYPRELVWQLTTFRHELKRNKGFEKLHKFIQQANDSGLITRQELVSMLPPLLLDVQSTDVIFDMCAAPGSKTSQLLELLYRDEGQGKGITKGGVLANDVDTSRANMLIHQLQRISTAGMMVVNHHAQYFPTLKAAGEPANLGETNRFYFDKILADVPCTGDGAIRKIPQKWKSWSPRDGLCLHGLQLQILMRAIQLVKIGGLVLYSTCSINPIEDEAVITELFRRCNSDALELVDIQKEVPELEGLITRRGLLKWAVCENKSEGTMQEEQKTGDKGSVSEFFDTYESADQLPENYKGLLRGTMFPDTIEKMRDVYKIQNTVRLMPHDQNTGGFYLALIRKKNHVVFGSGQEKTQQKGEQTQDKIVKTAQNEDEEQEAIKRLAVDETEALKHTSDPAEVKAAPEADQEEEAKEQEEAVDTVQENQGPGEGQRGRNKSGSKKKDAFVPLDPKEWESIRDFYGLDEQLKNLFIQQTPGDKKVWLISPGIQKLLELDRTKSEKFV